MPEHRERHELGRKPEGSGLRGEKPGPGLRPRPSPGGIPARHPPAVGAARNRRGLVFPAQVLTRDVRNIARPGDPREPRKRGADPRGSPMEFISDPSSFPSSCRGPRHRAADEGADTGGLRRNFSWTSLESRARGRLRACTLHLGARRARARHRRHGHGDGLRRRRCSPALPFMGEGAGLPRCKTGRMLRRDRPPVRIPGQGSRRSGKPPSAVRNRVGKAIRQGAARPRPAPPGVVRRRAGALSRRFGQRSVPCLLFTRSPRGSA